MSTNEAEIQLQRMERVLELSRELTSTVSLEGLLDQIVEAAVELTDCESVAILLLDEPSGDLRFVAVTRFAERLIDVPVPVENSIAGAAFFSGEPVVVPDVSADPRFYPIVEQITGFEARSLLAVPLQFEERRIGVLEAQNKRGDQGFGQEDVDLLVALAAQATIAIENARLVEQLQQAQNALERRVQARTADLEQANAALKEQIAERAQIEDQLRQRNHQLALLNRLGQQFSAMLDLEQVTERLPKAIADIVGVEGASLWLWDEEQEGWLVCRAAYQPYVEHATPVNLRLPPGEGIAGWVAETGESLIVPTVSQDLRFFAGIDEQTGFRTTSLLAVPLQIHYATIGVMELVNKLDGEFNADDLMLVETLAVSAAIAIDNAVLFDARRQLADELKARNKELDAFAHTVAHDLKGALSNVMGFASLIKEDHSQMLADQVQKSLDFIYESGQKMADIVDELLLLANVRKAEDWQIEPLDMPHIVDQALRRLAYMVEESQAEVVLIDVSDWPVALGYAPWIEEVWVNYLSNALKYGGRPPRVELGATTQADGQVRFWVRDNGPGLSADEQAELFIPFTRLHEEHIQGYGLGLSIVRRILEKLGGQVGVESPREPGQGSTFYFVLSPAASGEPAS